MLYRNSAAGNKKITMFISRLMKPEQMPTTKNKDSTSRAYKKGDKAWA